LEDRFVLSAGPFGELSELSAPSQGDANDEIKTQTAPVVTVPTDQTTLEGVVLGFGSTSGRTIRIDDPGIGLNRLVVYLSAQNPQGGPSPSLFVPQILGLEPIIGNHSNTVRLEGLLPIVNLALTQLTFSSPDDGDFQFLVTAIDTGSGETSNGSFQILAANAAPQLTFGAESGEEGTVVTASLSVSDQGSTDQPQVSWTVSRDGAQVAQGTGTEVSFFAPSDGPYELTAIAVDKDGGVATLENQIIMVNNVAPSFILQGKLQDLLLTVDIEIDDPGQELFYVEVYWTDDGIPETFATTQRVLTLTHRYLPGELQLDGKDLIVTVSVRDNESLSRGTLHFREAAAVPPDPQRAVPPAAIVAPGRTEVSRPGHSTTPPQLVADDLGRSLAAGRQEEVAAPRFVLRVVGPDGTESGDYVLPNESLGNLPAYLAALGVPDGHYRVYLVQGEFERLIVDAHLRGGRLIDPNIESRSIFNRPPVSDDSMKAATSPAPVAANDQMIAHAAAAMPDDRPAAVAGLTEGDEQPTQDERENAVRDDLLFASPILAGAVIAGAVSRRRAVSRRTRRETSDIPPPRLTKSARRARKLIQCAPSAGAILPTLTGENSQFPSVPTSLAATC
jgi:hypothetical protein